MKKIWILLGIALVLFVLWASRETFGEYTATKAGKTLAIKKPPLTAAEVTRAKGLYTRESSWTWPALTDAEVRTALEGFWPTWEAAQNTITLSQVTGYAGTLTPAEKKPEYIQLVRAYYIEQGQDVFSSAYQSILNAMGQGAASGSGSGSGTGAGTGSGSGAGSGSGTGAGTGAGTTTGGAAAGSGTGSGAGGTPVPAPDPSNSLMPYPQSFIDGIYNQIPQAIRTAALQEMTEIPTPEQVLKVSLGTATARIYDEVYKIATAPLTDSAIANIINAPTPAGPTPTPAFKAFLIEGMKIVFVGKPLPPPGGAAAGGTTTGGAGAGTGTTTGGAAGGSGTTTTGGAATGGTTTESRGESVLARTRPGTGDPNLRAAVASYAGIPLNDPLVNRMIAQVQAFYDRVYLPSGKRMPSRSDITSFVESATDIPPERRPSLTSAIDYWFTEPAPPGDIRLESDTPEGVGKGIAGSNGTWMSDGTASTGRVWGPPFSGLGAPRDLSGGGNGGDGYPALLGPPPQGDKYWSNTMPSSASLGTDALSRFLPFSRQPGDMDLVPDPYRVSQSYSPSSYSSKNEPVPFLTDFSAFQK